MKILLLLSSFVFTVFNLSGQQIILKENVIQNGKSYFITLEKHNGTSQVWARTKLNMSNFDDVKILDIQSGMVDKDKAMSALCRGKKVYDTGKTVAGCAATIGTGICMATAGGGGAGVPVCYATIYYTATTGFVDCVSGLASLISRHYGQEDFGVAIEQAAGSLSVGSFVSIAIEEACTDWKANK